VGRIKFLYGQPCSGCAGSTKLQPILSHKMSG